MKKELWATALLVVILISCLINIRCIGNITDRVIDLIKSAESDAVSENWDSALEKVEAAIALWSDKNSFINIVLSHDDIDAATESLYELKKEIYSQNSDSISGTAQTAIAKYNSIKLMDQIRLGSIF